MGGNSKGCPNCGHDLVIERKVVQAAGSRQVRLSWFMCQNCRHVALGEWGYVEVDETQTAPQEQVGR